MKFYDIDGALREAIQAGDKPVRVKVEIQNGVHFETVEEQDILDARFFCMKEAAGGTSARGDLLIDNPQGIYSFDGTGPGSQVKVSFSIGEGLSYFQRFIFYLDDNGLYETFGYGRKHCLWLGLRDLSYTLRKSDEVKDWTSPAVFAYSVVCDKTRVENSLVHGIAERARLVESDIDCSTIPVTLPYVRLKRNIWAELSSLAIAYRCHLECPVEKPLVFAHSPYQSETFLDEEISHTFSGEDIYYFRKNSREDLYKNTIRLKINMPVSLERQEIWRYDDTPVFYSEDLQARYPFRHPFTRKIEKGNYEARYRVTDGNGKERDVIFADEMDTKEEAENRLDYEGGPFGYSFYDVATNHDRAILKLHKDNDGDLYHASIHGRPIVLDLNRSFFIRDEREINQHGTAALNVIGSYFSDYEIEGRPQYQDWAVRELAARIQKRREFVVKTHRCLFHARVGAKVNVTVNGETVTGKINNILLWYRKKTAFIAKFGILEGG